MKIERMMQVTSLIILSVAIFSESRPEDLRICRDTRSDIVFVLDSSNSIWGPDYVRQLNFVKNLVSQFKIGESKVRVGLVTFGSRAHVAFHLNTHTEMRSLTNAIGNVQRPLGYKTNTAAALSLVAKMFEPENGGRPDVQHVTIVFTDGQSSDTTATASAAQRLQVQGVKILAIGIGKSADKTELEVISSSPENVFIAPNYRALNSIFHQLSKQTCDIVSTAAPEVTTEKKLLSTEKTTKQLTTKAPIVTTTDAPAQVTKPTTELPSLDESAKKVCTNKKADILFLLDTSSSIRTDEFRKQLNFVKDMVSKLDISAQTTRVALSLFSHHYYPIFGLAKYSNAKDVQAAIDSVRYKSGGTRIGMVLESIRLGELSEDNVRKDSQRILVVFTDGLASDYKKAKNESSFLKISGVRIFVVGIGRNTDKEELVAMASKPTENFLFTVESFDVLLSKSEIVAKKTCTAGTGKELPPKDEKVCNTLVPSDIVFMVSNVLFGREKVALIQKLIVEIVSRLKTATGVLRVGVLYEDCLPNQDIALSAHGDFVKDLSAFRYGSVAALVRKLRTQRAEASKGEGVNNARRVGVLFVDSSVDIDEELLAEAKEADKQKIELYVVAIGGDITKELAVQLATSTGERLIHVRTYRQLLSFVPRTFTQKLCRKKTGADVLPS